MTVGFLVAYALLSVIHVWSCVKGLIWLRASTKPMLMPLLLVAYLSSGAASVFVIVALILATVGDVLLMGSAKGGRLMLGAGSFFFGHLAYLCFFIPGIRLTDATWWVLLVAIFCIGAGLLLHRSVRRNLGQLRVLAVVYIVVLNAMSLAAFLRYTTAGSVAALLVFIGSAIFVLSDYIMFIDEFHHKLHHGGYAIMLTYCLAQGLMIGGLIFG